MEQGTEQPITALSPPTAYPIVGARGYRSKLQRPCDLCRARKVLCNTPDATQPCLSCQKTERQCTFNNNASKKFKNNNGHSSTVCLVEPHREDTTPRTQPAYDTLLLGANDHSERIFNPRDLETGHLAGVPTVNMWSGEGSTGWNLPVDQPIQWVDNIRQDLGFVYDDGDKEEALPVIERGTFEHSYCHLGPSKSLDDRPGCSIHQIGFSNESDPFSLNHFPYNNSNELDFFQVTYRKMPIPNLPSPMDASDIAPAHFVYSQSKTASEAQRVVNQCMSGNDDRQNLQNLVDLPTGVALVTLYFEYVFASLPIVSRTQILRDKEAFVKVGPTGLLAGIYALALPFMHWDETLCVSNAYSKPRVDQLWQVSFTCLQKELHFPRLATLQTSLLLLNFPPFDPVSVDTPFVWSSAASMLAIAQSLGLCIDPTGWDLPKWEIRLRRRLWWAVFVEYSWRSITNGRASTIADDDWNVSPLALTDFEMDLDSITSENADCGNGSGSDRYSATSPSADYFIHLCSLTQITNAICRKFFALRVVSRPQSLDLLIELAQELRQQLLDWHDNLPPPLRIICERNTDPPDDSIKSHASLLVSYYTAHILVFRALLRPIINQDIAPQLLPKADTVLQACRDFMQTIITFVRQLDHRHQSAFWPAYTRHCLAYPGLFCYMLCLQQREPQRASADRNLLDTWRKLLRSRLQYWPFLRFAIVKVDALYWKKSD